MGCNQSSQPDTVIDTKTAFIQGEGDGQMALYLDDEKFTRKEGKVAIADDQRPSRRHPTMMRGIGDTYTWRGRTESLVAIGSDESQEDQSSAGSGWSDAEGRRRSNRLQDSSDDDDGFAIGGEFDSVRFGVVGVRGDNLDHEIRARKRTDGDGESANNGEGKIMAQRVQDSIGGKQHGTPRRKKHRGASRRERHKKMHA